ncbi:hypothetical protein GETHLI_04240 [Geothrix limicola]|uniref:Uncharacterized protein n=1 Tax=Geothrix limicola TaxID=2927978 RepID=A0ABQ5QB38_9BACT|nr:hypothetical protein [Geothrix limicola]GLH71922.1 hypothetical protein GETHLI_04240 [Geothrix limicola]
MNSRLSFRKESIQRSSSASESLHQAQKAQGLKAAREQKPFSFTTVLTTQG